MPEINLNYPPQWSNGPSYAQKAAGKFPSVAIANGKRYERQAIAHLAAYFALQGKEFKASPWLYYQEISGRYNYCQPDFLVITESEIKIFEIKIRHTREAIPQLKKYHSVLSILYPDKQFTLIEFCRTFDPAEGFLPILDSLGASCNEIGAYIWRP